MRLSKEQKFLYSRVAILIASVGWIVSAFAGFKGFPFWYGGFVLCFWLAFGMINYKEKSSVWLFHNKPRLFALFYAALAGTLFLGDQFGLNMHLWFYPFYKGFALLFVWLGLYPFGGLATLELLYFLSSYFGEPLRFERRPETRRHDFFDVLEPLIFLAMIGVIVKGAIGIGPEIGAPVAIIISIIWILAAMVKIKFHIRHPGHYALILVLTALIAAISYELPNAIAREWVYLDAPFLNLSALGLPLWFWILWFLFTLIPLRLWIFLVLHQKMK
ncbi:MAG TPA: hypothetical protein DEF00_02925 [Candidatus Taylorbacteria bacterium]|nr:MAG: hypothetical protein UY03_C0031G0002 [Parcubacteria group bacterium GW2011_GWA2_47_64]KKU96459.1 MAG: hypothetical protein UY29_C0011G0018 [Parcubacteria group bacterium GW2011_GWC2_48_17]HBV01319.1 hypothetical protein [Candidatus Taylorbacteria bacterium]